MYLMCKCKQIPFCAYSLSTSALSIVPAPRAKRAVRIPQRGMSTWSEKRSYISCHMEYFNDMFSSYRAGDSVGDTVGEKIESEPGATIQNKYFFQGLEPIRANTLAYVFVCVIIYA